MGMRPVKAAKPFRFLDLLGGKHAPIRTAVPSIPRSRRKMLFEALEPRLLLSSSLPGTDAVASLIVNRLHDDATASLVEQGLDRSVPRIVGLQGGGNALVGAQGDNRWVVSGPDQVDLNGQRFTDIGYLVGSENSEDTFVLAIGGSLSGGMHGGPGGFDTLVIDGGHFFDVDYRPSGPDSGAVLLDGQAVRYAGLEPVDDLTAATNKTFNAATVGDDQILIADDATVGVVAISSITAGFEAHRILEPTRQLTVLSGGGSDTLRFDLLSFCLLYTSPSPRD